MNVIRHSGSGDVPSATRRIDPVRLAIRAAYFGTGLGAAGSVYLRLHAAVGDPLPAAMVTLLAVMMLVVLVASKADRQ